jgi:hypothetical protein
MTDVLVTIRLDSGQTETYYIDYLPTLEAAYAASVGPREEPRAPRATRGRRGSLTGAKRRAPRAAR